MFGQFPGHWLVNTPGVNSLTAAVSLRLILSSVFEFANLTFDSIHSFIHSSKAYFVPDPMLTLGIPK